MPELVAVVRQRDPDRLASRSAWTIAGTVFPRDAAGRENDRRVLFSGEQRRPIRGRLPRQRLDDEGALLNHAVPVLSRTSSGAGNSSTGIAGGLNAAAKCREVSPEYALSSHDDRRSYAGIGCRVHRQFKWLRRPAAPRTTARSARCRRWPARGSAPEAKLMTVRRRPPPSAACRRRTFSAPRSCRRMRCPP